MKMNFLALSDLEDYRVQMGRCLGLVCKVGERNEVLGEGPPFAVKCTGFVGSLNPQ